MGQDGVSRSLLDLPRDALRHALYEHCVTDPPRLCRFIDAVHPRRPLVLREDFCGSGALARAWAARSPRHRAVAVDSDARVLQFPASAPRVTPRPIDVRDARDRADVIAATNFPIGYFHRRGDLLDYLRRARAALRPGGIFLCDTYGGPDALRPLRLTARLRGPSGERIEHTWEQRSADPITARVVDALHFRVSLPGRRPVVLRDAFVYHWRLWTIPELRDALEEAGFRRIEVHARLGHAVDSRGRLRVRPVRDPAELDENYVVYIVAGR
jgi:SAM-dependent methyltransferase